ncbi:glutathione S-transferase [Mycena alexandri]|uniref:glutathione transferase n=1 Tax=Mycena alexandri TaxID=1745969 RepID=A0AAD6X6X3_9AGAR|nr:glutathione S-transferase [Mycena alexandri]
MIKAHKTPEFLEKQPLGQVPYLDDDGFIVYESRAICRYITAKVSRIRAHPDRPRGERALRAADALRADRATLAWRSIRMASYRKIMGVEADKAVIDSLMATLDKTLEGYDVILGKHRCLAGDTLTLTDLFHIPYISYVGLQGSDIMTKRLNVARWYNELVARPSWLTYVGGVKSALEY